MLDMYHIGKHYRFEIDDYFELCPYLENAWEFRGNCPLTGKKDGLILIEHPLQIKLPYIGKTFAGAGFRGVIEPFLRFIESRYPKKFIMQRNFPTQKSESKKAKQINDRCREISADAIKHGHAILNNYKILSKTYETCAHLEIMIMFWLNENHRLFHPETDNILSWCDTTLFYSNLKKNEPNPWVDDEIFDWNDSPFYRDFEHCYMFHDLLAHRRVNLKDLIQVGFVSIDFNLKFEKNYDFSNELDTELQHLHSDVPSALFFDKIMRIWTKRNHKCLIK